MTATIAALLAPAVARLREAGVERPRAEAERLLAHVLAVDRGDVLAHPERAVDAAAASAFAALAQRRAAREPFSHLVGQRWFWSLRFAVGPAVLDPRPDSETLVQAALDALPDRAAALTIVDLGVGSGCLLLALLHELHNARGVGIDASPAALEVAGANAERLGLAGRVGWLQGDWGSLDIPPADLVVGNPPYIPSAEIDRLAPEVRLHEPRLALDGGADGLAAFRVLLPRIAGALRAGGVCVLEHGEGQADAVAALAAAAGFRHRGRARDLGGRERCAILRR